MSHHTIDLTWNEALSGIFGAMSLAAWIFLLVPQLIENYRLQSADGISLLFLFVWFFGDLTNFIGAAWAGLVPTVIVLAVYFCFADFVLISQCIYYNVLNARRDARAEGRRGPGETETETETETEPLLQRRSSTFSVGSGIGLPGSHRRRRSSAASSQRRAQGAASYVMDQIAEEDYGGKGWLRNLLSVLFVCLAGVAGWALAWKGGAWTPAPAGDGQHEAANLELGPQLLGYTSAICYLGARIPQIVKNQRERSCEGLSLLFFMLSLLGNATYGAGILFHSVEKSYVLKNLPWLIGSIGTIAEDMIIFIQFHTFKKAPAPEEPES